MAIVFIFISWLILFWGSWDMASLFKNVLILHILLPVRSKWYTNIYVNIYIQSVVELYKYYYTVSRMWLLFPGICSIRLYNYIKLYPLRVTYLQITIVFVKTSEIHDDVSKCKHFPRYWLFWRGIHRSAVNSPHKGQWHGTLMFSLICPWINAWVNNRETCYLRRHCTHYDVIVM